MKTTADLLFKLKHAIDTGHFAVFDHAEATTLIEAVSDPAHQAELRIIADRRESALMGES